jgi:hypothetical protein
VGAALRARAGVAVSVGWLGRLRWRGGGALGTPPSRVTVAVAVSVSVPRKEDDIEEGRAEEGRAEAEDEEVEARRVARRRRRRVRIPWRREVVGVEEEG